MLKKQSIIIIQKYFKPCLLHALFTICVFISFHNYAQQIPHYTQYNYNMQVLNPAFVGTRADLSMSFLTRQQWAGIEGAPTTNTFSINGRTFRGVGMGVTVINDQIGLADITSGSVDFSYTIPTSANSRLAIGLKGSLSYFNNNLSAGITPDNDVNNATNGSYPNVGFGAFYHTSNFYLGLSLPHLLKTTEFKTETTAKNTGNNLNINNIFFTAGHIYEISEALLFKPSTLVKYSENLPVSIDFNANFLYRKSIEAGISYRYNSSVSALLAFAINKKLRIGYSYDYNLQNFGNTLSTHEIVLHIDLHIKRNSRWLLLDNCYF